MADQHNIPPEELVKTVEVEPGQLGGRFSGRLTPKGRRIWITDKGDDHVFPDGHPERVVVRVG